MKKLILTILCIITALQLTACSGTVYKDEEKLQIVTTVFPYYDFARSIAGDKAQVTLLLQPGGEAHSYEPTPQDIIKIKESDLFINSGRDADPWTDAVINDADSKKLNVVSAMEHVEIMLEEHEQHLSIVHADPHVWTSPENAQEIAEAITEALCRIDPDNSGYYEKNSAEYTAALSALDDEFEKLTERKKNKTIVFADRFAMRYFTDEYGLKYFSAYPGCSAESEPSAATVAELIDIVREEKISVVFYTETSNGRLPDTVCEETGAEKLLFHSCHTVTKEQLEGGITYIDLMKENYKALEKALG